MIKRLLSFIVIILIFLSTPTQINAKNEVHEIEVIAVINKDGSIIIIQDWYGTFTEGTEIYIPMNLGENLSIEHLSVSDEHHFYQEIDEWNVEASFEEKKEKFGIVSTAEGIELCFGISRYGENHYTISYQLTDVISSFTDLDGANIRFVNDEMNTTPTDVAVFIIMADGTPLSEENSSIWAFGFEGDIFFQEGMIVAQTTSPLTVENNVTLLFGLEKGLVEPSIADERSFEEIKALAFEGSDYEVEEISWIEIILSIFITIILPISLIIWILQRRKKKRLKQLKNFSEAFGYFRDVPNEGVLGATYTLGLSFQLCKEESILGTGILRLIQKECLEPIIINEKNWIGKEEEILSLRIKQCSNLEQMDEMLYSLLKQASGEDGILQGKELENFVFQNDGVLRELLNKYQLVGKEYLSNKQCIKRWRNPMVIKDLTTTGEQELGELLGFKRYLEDFSLIAERNVKEILIWRELLSLAMLFGIADEVARQIKDLYPEINMDLVKYEQGMNTSYSYNHYLYNGLIRAERERELAKRNEGGGGFSSLGGGGGFSGGSTGGGTR